MGLDVSNNMYFGIKLTSKTFEQMKTKTTAIKIIQPKTKFNAHTGKKNLPYEKPYTTFEWKPEYQFMEKIFDDDHCDDLYNGGADINGLRLISGWGDVNHYFIVEPDTEITLGSQKYCNVLEKIEVPDMKALESRMKKKLEPLGLWSPKAFGVWFTSEWA